MNFRNNGGSLSVDQIRSYVAFKIIEAVGVILMGLILQPAFNYLAGVVGCPEVGFMVSIGLAFLVKYLIMLVSMFRLAARE